MKHLAALRVTPDLIFNLLQGWKSGDFIQLPNLDLPDDVKFVSVNWQVERQCFYCVFEHESFPATPEGGVIFILSPEISEFKIPVDFVKL